jgi:hypothetical protein
MTLGKDVKVLVQTYMQNRPHTEGLARPSINPTPKQLYERLFTEKLLSSEERDHDENVFVQGTEKENQFKCLG